MMSLDKSQDISNKDSFSGNRPSSDTNSENQEDFTLRRLFGLKEFESIVLNLKKHNIKMFNCLNVFGFTLGLLFNYLSLNIKIKK